MNIYQRIDTTKPKGLVNDMNLQQTQIQLSFFSENYVLNDQRQHDKSFSQLYFFKLKRLYYILCFTL